MSEDRRLYRSREDRWIAGVCGGLARYFNIDPTLMRVLWIIFVLASFGTAVVAYLLLWLLVDMEPAEPEQTS